MSISVSKNNNVSFKGFYQNRLLKKGLEFASSNGALFVAGTSLTLSAVVRPIAILSTPKTDKENKKVACAKSISSSFVGYLLTGAISVPIASAIEKIDKAPKKYLNSQSIQNLKGNSVKLVKSKAYKFATQFFKLGSGAVVAFPKAFLTCAFLPFFLSKLFKKNNQDELKNEQQKNMSFRGNPKTSDFLAKKIGKVINTSFMQKLSDKLKDTNFPMHFNIMTDILSTGLFVNWTNKNKDIAENRKQALINNSIISTGLCVLGGYVLDKVLEKPTEKFIKKFSQANKNSKKLDKYIEGIKIVKPALILGGIYYVVIPVISTFFAERVGKLKN